MPLPLCMQIVPPLYTVYPVEDANKVFHKLSHSQLNGRAVFRVCSGEDSVFFSPSMEQLLSETASTEFSIDNDTEAEEVDASAAQDTTGPDVSSISTFFLQ